MCFPLMYFETYHVSCQTPTVVHYSVANPIRALGNTAPQAPGKLLSHPSAASKHHTQLVRSLTPRPPTLSTLTQSPCNRPTPPLRLLLPLVREQNIPGMSLPTVPSGPDVLEVPASPGHVDVSPYRFLGCVLEIIGRFFCLYFEGPRVF